MSGKGAIRRVGDFGNHARANRPETPMPLAVVCGPDEG